MFRSHKFLCTLVTNQFGSVITDCAITDDGKLVVCVESEQLLVWDLKTQSVRQRLPAPQVHQVVLLFGDKMIGVLYKALDTNEQKMGRLVVYRLSDLVVFYTYEFPCRVFRDIIVQKVMLESKLIYPPLGHNHRGSDSSIERTRPNPNNQYTRKNGEAEVSVSPSVDHERAKPERPE
jgi:hypothetical protein